MVVLVWSVGADGLVRTDGGLPLHPLLGLSFNPVELSQAISIVLLGVGIVGIATILTILLRRQRRLDALLRMRGADHTIASRSERVAVIVPSGAIAAARQRLAECLHDADAALIVDPLPEIVADPELLAEIFTRLIGNAVRFRSPLRRPVVHVSALRDGAMIDFRVRDNGLGLDPARAARLCEILRHPGKSGGGIGMGLTVVRGLVEQMGGRIWVDLIPGQDGTTFGFSLPSPVHPHRRADDYRPV
ncbi:ATP-binding protein [Magnetospirillum fulvum]|uniref:histidine kinase n=1 Tax=Magnetospirillum fulvum TaxID=1082 RepID=A0A1H6HVH5_MAGFU|nr:ATP-binding protein [Magnetospirillum fulvum]SEH38131.1 Histidine kinase-, DNA gyrase B-, and HSP90-like ATPase [Magnetospirillum fulvum]